MRAMLLCAGLSTRLGPLGAERPKPMLPVCNHPILAYGISNLVAHGVRDLVINTHHLGEVIRGELGDGRAFGARIQYIHEPAILGTGGGVRNALPLLDPDGRDEPFLVCNGKLIFDADLTAVLAAHRADPEVLATLVCRRVPDAKTWGAVAVRHDARGAHAVDIRGDGDHMYLGVQVARPSVIARLPPGESDSIGDGYLPWLRAGERVAVFEHPGGYFAEHSTPERYLASNLALLGGARLTNPPGRLGGIDPTARIHPTARIVAPAMVGAGAVIGAGAVVGPDVVVGDGAIVRASLAASVVWSGATVEPGTQPGIIT